MDAGFLDWFTNDLEYLPGADRLYVALGLEVLGLLCVFVAIPHTRGFVVGLLLGVIGFGLVARLLYRFLRLLDTRRLPPWINTALGAVAVAGAVGICYAFLS